MLVHTKERACRIDFDSQLQVAEKRVCISEAFLGKADLGLHGLQ